MPRNHITINPNIAKVKKKESGRVRHPMTAPGDLSLPSMALVLSESDWAKAVHESRLWNSRWCKRLWYIKILNFWWYVLPSSVRLSRDIQSSVGDVPTFRSYPFKVIAMILLQCDRKIYVQLWKLTSRLISQLQWSHLNPRARHVAAMISDLTGLRDQLLPKPR